jgi:hypothetical protein
MTDEKGRLWLGLIICWGCNLLNLAVGWFLIIVVMPVGLIVFGGIGLVQLAYVIPFYNHFKAKGQTNVANGLIIAASITVLLNVGCWTRIGVGG